MGLARRGRRQTEGWVDGERERDVHIGRGRSTNGKQERNDVLLLLLLLLVDVLVERFANNRGSLFFLSAFIELETFSSKLYPLHRIEFETRLGRNLEKNRLNGLVPFPSASS